MTTDHPIQPPAKQPSLAESIISTSAVRAETTLQARQWEAIIETLVDGLIVFDAHGNLLHMNAAARALLGHERQPDYSLKKAAERPSPYHPRDEYGQALVIEHWPITRILRGETLRGADAVDVLLVNQDGQELEVNVSGSPLRDETGQLVGAVVTLHDVTERRRLSRRTKEALEALLAMAETLVQAPSPAQVPQAATSPAPNQVAQRLVELTRSVLGCSRVSIAGVEPETELQRPIAAIGLRPEEEYYWWHEQGKHRISEGSDPTLAPRLRAGELIVFDFTRPPYSDSPNPYQVKTMLAAPMRVGEQLVGLLGLDFGDTAHTFTPEELALAEAVAQLGALMLEQERLLHERAEAEARVLALQEANQRLETFISIVSHELRTPITSIKANLQIVLRRIKQARGAADIADRLAQPLELLERMEQQMRRLTRLLNDVIDLARIRTGRLDIAPEPCDLGTLLLEIAQEEQAGNPGRTIQVELPLERKVPVMADPDRIGQVISNYLSNALKYSLADQPVQVGLALERSQARVWVRDQGPGIPAEEQPRIWELFQRVPGIEVQSGSGVGLGLGLHISKSLIERHGGQVGLDSAPGIGSTFWFTLPLAAEGHDEAE